MAGYVKFSMFAVSIIPTKINITKTQLVFSKQGNKNLLYIILFHLPRYLALLELESYDLFEEEIREERERRE